MVLHTIDPVAEGSYTGWVPLGAYPKAQALSDSSDATGLVPIAASAQQSLVMSNVPADPGAVVVAFDARVRAQLAAGSGGSFRILVRWNGLDVLSPVFETEGLNTFTFRAPKPGGGSWTVGDVNMAEVGLSHPNWFGDAFSPRTLKLWGDIDYLPTPSRLPAVRDLLSRMLLGESGEPLVLEDDFPLEALDLELGDLFGFTHYAGPTGDPNGWGAEIPARGLFRQVERVLDLNRRTVTVKAIDQRDQLASYRETAQFVETSTQERQGTAVLGGGNLRVFTRSSKAWAEDLGDGLVREVGLHAEKIERLGYLYENRATNRLKRSSAVSGTVGIDYTGPGSFTKETNPPEPLFDPVVTNGCYLLTAGAVHNTDGVARWPATSVLPAGARASLSTDHLDDPDAPLVLRVRRAVDGAWLRGLDGTWLGSPHNNVLPVRTSRHRDGFEVAVGGNATALDIFAVQQGVGPPLRRNRVYHLQLDDGLTWAGSRVVTDAEEFTREFEVLRIRNNDDLARAFENARGTLRCRAAALWSRGQAASLGIRPTVFEVVHDDTNHWRLFYDPAPGELVFEAQVFGTVFQARRAVDVVPGRVYRLACRWTSTRRELGMPRRTMSVFVDGVRGIDVVRGRDPEDTAASHVVLGGQHPHSWNGHLSDVWFDRTCRTDLEMKRAVW